MTEVFISYSSKDVEIAREVCSYMEQQCISCWIDYRDIGKGEPYAREIVRGIKETSIFVVLFSHNSNISENVINELDQAYGLNRTIIPFKLDKTEMNDELKLYLARKQWIDAFSNFEKGLSQLAMRCMELLGKYGKDVSCNKIHPQWAAYLSREQKAALQKLIEDLVCVEGGRCEIGATQEQKHDAYEWEKPVHKVVLSNFRITKHLITQEIWSSIMPYNNSLNKSEKNLPVENVTWEECDEFIKTINEMTGLSFKLPTEAQWEYAARGAGKYRGKKYSGDNCACEVAWFGENSDKRTHPVGEKKANELGIYDMSGNVWEWCSDWYDVYDTQIVTDPVGAASGTRKVLRGGCANTASGNCRVSYRIGRNVKYKDGFLGFRLVLQ